MNDNFIDNKANNYEKFKNLNLDYIHMVIIVCLLFLFLNYKDISPIV